MIDWVDKYTRTSNLPLLVIRGPIKLRQAFANNKTHAALHSSRLTAMGAFLTDCLWSQVHGGVLLGVTWTSAAEIYADDPPPTMPPR